MHYICTGGCKGESAEPGVCQAKDCPRHGDDLTECDCHDGSHYGAFSSEPAPAKQQEDEEDDRERLHRR